LTKEVARRFEFEGAYPILIITDVDPDGSAGQVGLKPGDLVLQINNATVQNLEEFSLEVEKITEGDKVNLRITRISVGVFGQVQRQFLVALKAEKKKPRRYAF
jgi:S1-C subfamily serine protease